jgi:hypothetical protein
MMLFLFYVMVVKIFPQQKKYATGTGNHAEFFVSQQRLTPEREKKQDAQSGDENA